MSMHVFVNNIAVVAPNVQNTRDIEGFAAQPPCDDWKATPESIAPRARRRLSPQSLLAIASAETIAASLDNDAPWVFASCFGEGETLQIILESLSTKAMSIRPLRFQNSVHNAASGQWSIANARTGAMTSLCAADDTFAAGLLKSALQLTSEGGELGFVTYDHPLPYPLSETHVMDAPAGVALALSAKASDTTMAQMEISLESRAMVRPDHPVRAAAPLLSALGAPAGQTVDIALARGLALVAKVKTP